MGFTSEEIRESLKTNKYDEVMATYLLLDETRLTSADAINIDTSFLHNASLAENAAKAGRPVQQKRSEAKRCVFLN